MLGIETSNRNSHHLAWVVHTELEPFVVAEVSVESLNLAAIIFLVEMLIAILSNTGVLKLNSPLKIQIGQFFKVLLNFYKKSRGFWTILDLRKYPIFGPFLKRFPLSIGQKSQKFSARFARQFS